MVAPASEALAGEALYDEPDLFDLAGWYSAVDGQQPVPFDVHHVVWNLSELPDGFVVELARPVPVAVAHHLQRPSPLRRTECWTGLCWNMD